MQIHQPRLVQLPLDVTGRIWNHNNRLCTEYNTQIIVGDFNALHPRWCSAHDRFKRGAKLLQLTHYLPEIVIHAPPFPPFLATKNKTTGALRSSTVDFLVSRVPIPQLTTISGYVMRFSDHRTIVFKIGSSIYRVSASRRVSKTLLQSTRLQKEIGLYYEVALQGPMGQLAQLRTNGTEANKLDVEEHAQESYWAAQLAITDPWTQQVKQRRRSDGPHVNAELRKLWARKKLLYDRQRWKPTCANKTRYKEICAQAQ